MAYDISLLREKFIIDDWKASSIRAVSNRIALNLRYSDGRIAERFIIRAQNAWSCTRMASLIIKRFDRQGPLMVREPDWKDFWKQSALTPYDKKYNEENLWGAVYFEDTALFSAGIRHEVLDVIEKCDHTNEGDYENIIPYVESVFEKAGKTVQIHYDANVALTFHMEKEIARMGLLYRNNGRRRNFHIHLKKPPKSEREIDKANIMLLGACYIEGIQLAIKIAVGNKMMRIKSKNFDRNAKEKYKETRQRLERLKAQIKSIEDHYKVLYRPEKPDFDYIIHESGG